MQRIIAGLCVYTLVASGIAIAQTPDTRQCPGGADMVRRQVQEQTVAGRLQRLLQELSVELPR
jgi:hypothetical protein